MGNSLLCLTGCNTQLRDVYGVKDRERDEVKKNEDSAGGDYLTFLIASFYFLAGKVGHTHIYFALLPFWHSKVCPRTRTMFSKKSMIAISNLLDYRNGPGRVGEVVRGQGGPAEKFGLGRKF